MLLYTNNSQNSVIGIVVHSCEYHPSCAWASVDVRQQLCFPILASVHVVNTKYRTRSNLKTEGFIRDHDLNRQSIVIRKTHDGDWLLSAEADA